MNENIPYIIMAGSCGVILLIALLKKRARFLLNFLVRIILGGIGIYFANNLLKEQQIAVAVGLNPVSLLTIGTLGISGFVLLYALVACDYL